MVCGSPYPPPLMQGPEPGQEMGRDAPPHNLQRSSPQCSDSWRSHKVHTARPPFGSGHLAMQLQNQVHCIPAAQQWLEAKCSVRALLNWARAWLQWRLTCYEFLPWGNLQQLVRRGISKSLPSETLLSDVMTPVPYKIHPTTALAASRFGWAWFLPLSDNIACHRVMRDMPLESKWVSEKKKKSVRLHFTEWIINRAISKRKWNNNLL